MSKIFKPSKKQKIIEQIHKVSEFATCNIQKRDAREMMMFYVRNGYLPSRLEKRAKELIALNIQEVCLPVKRISERHYLYAISNGQQLKVGYSINPKDRLKRLQTGNSTKLKIVWQTYVSEDDKEARRQEKKLHRALQRYSIRGEWFSIGGMEVLDKWIVKNHETKQEQQGLDMQAELDSQFFAMMA